MEQNNVEEQDIRKVTLTIGEVYMVRPDIGLSKQADWAYSKTFNEAINNGIPPNSVLDKKFKELGVWGEEQEQEITNLRGDYAKVVDKLTRERDRKKREPLKKEFQDARTVLLERVSIRNAYYAHSAETKAEEDRIRFLVLSCTRKIEDKSVRLWKDESIIVGIKNELAFQEAINEYLAFIGGLPSNYEDIIPGEEDPEKKEEEVTKEVKRGDTPKGK